MGQGLSGLAAAGVGVGTLAEAAIIFLSGLAAGAINSVAGGGTLLSFPVLLWLGRDPIVANVANTVALWPASLASAFAFRRELRAAPRLLAILLPISVAGSLLGAWLLLRTPTRWFSALVPGLILLATVMLALKRPILAGLARALPSENVDSEARDRRRLIGLVVGQILVATYGGYFGAAMGIMMLAALGLAGVGDIHQRNALKNITSAVINAGATVLFALSGAVDWALAGLLAAGAVTGGYLGGVLGRRLDARVAEGLVVVIGLVAAIAQLLRR